MDATQARRYRLQSSVFNEFVFLARAVIDHRPGVIDHRLVVIDYRHQSSMNSSPGPYGSYAGIGGSHSSWRRGLAGDVYTPVDIAHLEHLIA
jgi:hypothetical protein